LTEGLLASQVGGLVDWLVS